MASAPSNDNVFYAGGHYTFAMAVTKTTDGGNTWTRYILPPMVNFTKALAVDPTNASIVYAGGDSVLFKSINGGTSWTSVFNGLRGSVRALAVSFRTAAEIYAGTQYGFYRSTDAGLTWSNTGLSSVTSIAVDYNTPFAVFAGTAQGVFRSLNGISWSAMNQGLLDSSITCLDVQSNQVLYAGTAAAGVNGWSLWGRITESAGQSKQVLKVTAPSPIRGPALITYSLPARSRVRLVLYDNQGRLVRNIVSGTQCAGIHRIALPTDDLAAGVYFLELVTPETQSRQKLVVVR